MSWGRLLVTCVVIGAGVALGVALALWAVDVLTH